MPDERLIRKVFLWVHNARDRNWKNWNYKVEELFRKNDIIEYCDKGHNSSKYKYTSNVI